VAAPDDAATTPPQSIPGLEIDGACLFFRFRPEEFRMNALLLTTILAFAAADKADKDKEDASGPKLDGKWTIVYAEEAGRRNTAWETRPAMFKDGSLSYEEEGKKHSLQLKFGEHSHLTATTGLGKDGDKGGKGHYIASQDYVTISLTCEGNKPPAGSTGDFILILRRQRSK
jgi:hypothetical protein